MGGRGGPDVKGGHLSTSELISDHGRLTQINLKLIHINVSSGQAVGWSVGQSVSWSFGRTVGQGGHLSTSEIISDRGRLTQINLRLIYINLLSGQGVGRSVSWSVGQSNWWLVGQPVDQSVSQSVSRTIN